MNRTSPQLPGPAPGLLTRLLMAVAAAVLLVSAAFVGAFFFLVALGLLSVVLLVGGIRAWRFKREFERAVREGQRQSGSAPGRTTVEGDYTVITDSGSGGDGSARPRTGGER